MKLDFLKWNLIFLEYKLDRRSWIKLYVDQIKLYIDQVKLYVDQIKLYVD